jgi:hypothetical protein
METPNSSDPPQDTTPSTTVTKTHQTTNISTLSSQQWATDASISRLSRDILQHLQVDSPSPLSSGSPQACSNYEPQTDQTAPPAPSNQRIRFNLIRHKYTSGDTKTIQLFKSFATTLREIDQYLTILPVNSRKQHLSGLTNVKQIQSTDDNKMLTYFTPYYKKQSYSLSGYFHISTSYTFAALQQHQKLSEWLEYNRYFVKLCPSQEEEMVQVGALCYSSIFLYREDLKQSIISHPAWTDKFSHQAPIFDIYPADFTGSSKKTKMLFISAERSKQKETATFFTELYDGTVKDYPNGATMIFIPLYSGIVYSPDQRDKIIFNHEAFIGSEEAMCIGGLSDLNTPIKIKGGQEIPLRILLKSLPATHGMSRPQLFQLAEPNISGVTTIVTFQFTDKPYIESRKSTLETEIRKIIEPGEENKVFLDNKDGLWFGGVRKNKNGKVITVQQPCKLTIEHCNRISSILRSPPKKRPNSQVTQPNTSLPVPHKPEGHHQIRPQQTTTSPTTIQADPIPAQITEQFHQIAQEFQTQHERNMIFDQRIGTLERTTNKIDTNVETIMSRLDILLSNNPSNPSKQRKTSITTTDTDMIIDEAYPPSLLHNQRNGAGLP